MIFSKGIGKQDLAELRSLNKLIKQEQFKLNVVTKNTALVFKGQFFVKTQEDMINLLSGYQEQLVSSIAKKMGYTQGTPITIDLESGKISEKKQDDTKDRTS